METQKGPFKDYSLSKRGLYEPLSKLLVSPLITPIVVPYIIPYLTPFQGVQTIAHMSFHVSLRECRI